MGVSCGTLCQPWQMHQKTCPNSTFVTSNTATHGPITMDIGEERGTYYAYWVPTPEANGLSQPANWDKSQAEVTVYGANLPEAGLKFYPSFTQRTWQMWNVFTLESGKVIPAKNPPSL